MLEGHIWRLYKYDIWESATAHHIAHILQPKKQAFTLLHGRRRYFTIPPLHAQ